MKNPCNNDLVMTTQRAASFTAFKEKLSHEYNPSVRQECMDANGCFLHLDFVSDGPFPLEQFHELTRRLNDPTLEITVLSLNPATMQEVRYDYQRKIWIWQEEGRTTNAVPDDLCSPGRPA